MPPCARLLAHALLALLSLPVFMMARDRDRMAVPLVFPLALAAVVLFGAVDAFLPFSPSSYNVNVKLAQHVPAAASAAAGGKLRPVNSDRNSRFPAASAAMLMKSSQGARNSVPRSFSSTAAGGWCSATSMSRVFCRAGGLLSLDDHDAGDQGGGRGKGGVNGNGNGNGNGGNGDESSAGDEGSSDGRDPLVLAGVGSGLGAALDGLQEAIRNLRMPWARKVVRKEPVDSNTVAIRGVLSRRPIFVAIAVGMRHCSGCCCWGGRSRCRKFTI